MKKGTWFTSSESDSRWEGSGQDIISCHTELPGGLVQFLQDKMAELNRDIPEDLEWRFVPLETNDD